MELIGFAESYRTTACLAVLEASGLEYKPTLISFEELKTSERIKKLNPQAKVPILVTPEGPVYETMAIIRHISRLSNKHRGGSPYENALVDQWLSWASSDLSVIYPQFFYQHAGFEGPGISYKPEDIQRGKEAFLQKLSHLATSLQGKKYLVGNDVTIADITVACYVYQPMAFCLSDKERNQNKEVVTWLENIATMPFWKRYFGRLRFCAQPTKIPQP